MAAHMDLPSAPILPSNPRSSAPTPEPTAPGVAAAFESLDLRRRMTEHPYQTVLIGLGIGYVLGGGLFTPLTSRVVSIGLRAAALPLLQQTVLLALDGAPPSEGFDEAVT